MVIVQIFFSVYYVKPIDKKIKKKIDNDRYNNVVTPLYNN